MMMVAVVMLMAMVVVIMMMSVTVENLNIAKGTTDPRVEFILPK